MAIEGEFVPPDQWSPVVIGEAILDEASLAQVDKSTQSYQSQ
jgi:hypothetical protein